MSFSKFTKDMAIIQQLDDEPNDVGGMTAAELKAKFDEGGQALKDFLNDVLLPELEQGGVSDVIVSRTEKLKFFRIAANGYLQYSGDGNNWVTVLAVSNTGSGGGSSGGNAADFEYVLPVATVSALGGIKADKVTAKDTQPVRIGADGKLYTAPAENSGGSGGGSSDVVLPDNLLTTEGGTMEGPLRLYGDPLEDSEAATKRYVDRSKVVVDNTMTVSGAAADAKIVGAVVEELWKAINTSLESAKKYTDDKVGRVNEILDAINGEVI